jgi:hypothetical protein
MFGKRCLSIVFLLLVVFLAGFNKPEPISLDYISNRLLSGFTQVILEHDRVEDVILTNKEICILKKAIRDGKELVELLPGEPSEKPPLILKDTNNSLFTIKWPDKSHSELIYESQSGCFYIEKSDIPWKYRSSYWHNGYLAKKYLAGVFRFKPSSAIKEIRILSTN